MVNQILKCGGVLGDFVGLWVKRNLSWVTATSALVFALAVVGCEHDAETTLQASQSDASQAILQPESTEPQKLTTAGKPTRALETPRGDVDIYDPVMDSEVRSQFSRFMESDYAFSSPSRKNLRKVSKALTQEYRKNYCSIITDGECVRWDFRGCEGPPPYNCMLLPPGAVLRFSCELNNHNHDIRDFKTMKTLDEAITKYFELEWKKWKK